MSNLYAEVKKNYTKLWQFSPFHINTGKRVEGWYHCYKVNDETNW